MKMYLATWLEDNQGVTLTKVGGNKRLLSFYFLQDAPAGFLQEYAKTGIYKSKGGNKGNDQGKS